MRLEHSYRVKMIEVIAYQQPTMARKSLVASIWHASDDLSLMCEYHKVFHKIHAPLAIDRDTEDHAYTLGSN